MPAVKPVTFKVEGMREVLAALEELPKRVRKNVVRRSLYAGATIVRDEARRRVPVRTGALKKTIIARTNKPKKSYPDLFFGEVAIQSQAFNFGKKGRARKVKKDPMRTRKYYRGEIYPRNYAHLVEFGTAPHATGRGGMGGRMHPGARPKPFMRPAYESKKHEAVEVIRKSALENIDKEVAKLAAKGKGKGRGR